MADSSGSAGEFAALVAELGELISRLPGDVSVRGLARAGGVPHNTAAAWLNGRFPQQIDGFLRLVRAVRAAAERHGTAEPGSRAAQLLEERRWRAAHRARAQHNAAEVSAAVEGARARKILGGLAPGRLLGEVTDPFELEVHRPVQPDRPLPGLAQLPAYVTREHDDEVAQVAAAAAAGASGMVVLVGGSSTGKTRACWEALRLLRHLEGWRVWHPISPAHADAALRDLPGIVPRTVIWLNEAQFYLAPAGTGPKVAAGLRELLRDAGRAPVLVLATLWPAYWDELTVRPAEGADPHAQARELLVGHDVAVPAAFTPQQVRQLAGTADPRLAAAAAAQDGQVIQYLAGAPELLARYRHPRRPAVRALIEAAMDARRLGMDPALPLAFLHAAAPGYLTSPDADQLTDGWLRQALADTSRSAKGTRGPLTLVRPPPAHPAGPACRLADYLDQAGRRIRAGQTPPASFWAAAAAAARPADLTVLGQAAYDRGLYQHAAQLWKNAATSGDAEAAARLVDCMHQSHPGDPRPARHAVTHASLDDPPALAGLLGALRETWARDQARALAARAGDRASLDDPQAVSGLLGALRNADAEDLAWVLADQAADRVPLDDSRAVAWLLGALREAGARDQAQCLLSRARVIRAPLDDRPATAELLRALRWAGTGDQVRDVAEQAAAHASLDHPASDTVALLKALREAGADDQAQILADRAAADFPLDDRASVSLLFHELKRAGAVSQARALADRIAADFPLDQPHGVPLLLKLLPHDQSRALLIRAADRTPLDHAQAVAMLLRALREAGDHDRARALLARDPAARARLDDPRAVAQLLAELQASQARDQIRGLLARDPAARVLLDDPHAVGMLLKVLLRTLPQAGAGNQFQALATRAAADLPLGDPHAVVLLLQALREVDARDQIRDLLARDPAARVLLDDPGAVAALLTELRELGARDQVRDLLARDPAARVCLKDDKRAIDGLLSVLRKAGAHSQAEILENRLPAAGMFRKYCNFEEDRPQQFRFGRDPDSNSPACQPAPPWDWQDLSR